MLRGDVAASVAALKERFDAIVVWGSLMLADALFRPGLVDELRLRIVPVLIGAGRSFTPPDARRAPLALDHACASGRDTWRSTTGCAEPPLAPSSAPLAPSAARLGRDPVGVRSAPRRGTDSAVARGTPPRAGDTTACVNASSARHHQPAREQEHERDAARVALAERASPTSACPPRSPCTG